VLTGKRIVVTGGSRGIGLACAAELLAQGASVTICARGAGELALAEDRLAKDFGEERVASVSADVSSEVGVEQVFATHAARFGALDGVIHAAGVLAPIGAIVDVDPVDWLEGVRMNLFGTFLVTRTAARHMKEGGRIVALSGGGASGPLPNYTAYACAKVAIVRFVETVAIELHPKGIEINALAPGFVATRMHEETLRAGEAAGAEYLARTKAELESGGVAPEVPARAAAFLVSDRARGITGRFVSAVHDDWAHWPEHLAALADPDLFALRRVVPKDRGLTWQ